MLFPVIFRDYNDLSVHVHGLFEWTLGNPTKKKKTLYLDLNALISRDRWSNLQPLKCLLADFCYEQIWSLPNEKMTGRIHLALSSSTLGRISS